MPWEKGSLFQTITNQYVSYVQTKYGKLTVVFDSYNLASTKDMTHGRRTKGKTGILVSLTESTNLSVSKDVSLIDSTNK